jgi:hypothetical protein
MQEPALARAPRHFVRVTCGSYIHKVVHSCSLLLYIAIDDMATCYSHQLALLLSLLLHMLSSTKHYKLLPPSQGIRRPCFACFFFDQDLL